MILPIAMVFVLGYSPSEGEGRVVLDQTIHTDYAPTSCLLSLAVPFSLPPLVDDKAYAYHHGDASSTSPSASLKPKAPHKAPWVTWDN